MHDWMERLATIGGIIVFVVFVPALMFGWRELLSHLWGLGISWALFLGFIRVVAFVDGFPEDRKRLGQVLLLLALGVWLITSYYLIGPANEETVRGR